MGRFTVDEVEHSGAPDTITLRARSANLIDTFKQQQERSQDHAAAIIEAIAFQNEAAGYLQSQPARYCRAAMTKLLESDAASPAPAGQEIRDAVATVKNDTLLFIPINQEPHRQRQGAAGDLITRALGDGHRYRQRGDAHGRARLLA